ncbi:hypothetical protein [Hydrogenophaga sp.]|uniref:hypothetical protein n=1 Tax=Hydrogenophaga sp. TaxID=1904254 RepID=UPI003F7088B7
MFPTSLARLSLYGLLALAAWPACAQIGPQFVRKLSDGELTCLQIHAETLTLEKASQDHRIQATQAQAVMAEIQNEMLAQANVARRGGMGSAMGSGLIGMIPGGGQIQGYAMQAAADARRARMQEGVNKMMQVQTQLMNAEQALEHAQARSDHLVDLFLKKDCKLSQVSPALPVERVLHGRDD